MHGVEDEAEHFGFALIQHVERGVRHARGGVFGADYKDDAVHARGEAGDVVRRHDRRGVDQHVIIFLRGFFQEFFHGGPDEKFAGALRGRAARQ